LAVERLHAGDTVDDIADFLGVHPTSVRRWAAACRDGGEPALAAVPAGGRPPKLTHAQGKAVLRWLAGPATAHGFATDLWTGPRVARLVADVWGVALHPDYVSRWLRARGHTPQRPRRRPRERDDRAIADWAARDWPRVKKRPGGAGRPSR
jgi:transposase